MACYLLVEWKEEETRLFSVVSSNSLVDGTLRANPFSTKGKEVSIIWKSANYRAVVLEIGNNKTDLNNQADIMASKVSMDEFPLCGSSKSLDKRTKSGRITKRLVDRNKNESKRKIIKSLLHTSQTKASAINKVFVDSAPSSIINPQVQQPGRENLEVNTDWETLCAEKEKVKHLEVELNKFKEMYKKYKRKYKDARVELKLLKKNSPETEQVELFPDSGVFISREDMAAVKMTATSPSILARNLFRLCFSEDELLGHSLSGKKCNANKDCEPLPAVDHVRRDAITGFCLNFYGYTEKSLGITNNSSVKDIKSAQQKIKSAGSEIKKSLSDFVREVNKKRTPILASF